MTATITGNAWLPEGHHWDLHIEHHPIPTGRNYTPGGWKLCWHTPETPWQWYIQGVRYFKANPGKAPHLLIGKAPGMIHPYVAQFVPLNMPSFALEHPDGTPETNTAHCIQIEVCGYTDPHAGVDYLPEWPNLRYKALANLAGLIMHRVNIPNTAPRDFSNKTRFTPAGWIKASGHVGHMHCPNNDHHDPYRLREGFLVDLITNLPDAGYPL